MNDILTVKEASELLHITQHAFYMAIKKKKMKAIKIKNRWKISREELDNYRIRKHSRDFKVMDGEIIFSFEKGFFSASQVARIMSEELKRPIKNAYIYYLITKGRLRAFKRGWSWVIKREDAIECLEREMFSQSLFQQSS